MRRVELHVKGNNTALPYDVVRLDVPCTAQQVRYIRRLHKFLHKQAQNAQGRRCCELGKVWLNDYGFCKELERIVIDALINEYPARPV